MSWHPLNSFNKFEELENRVIALDKKVKKYELVLSIILDEFKNFNNAKNVLSNHIDLLCEKDKEIHEKWDVLCERDKKMHEKWDILSKGINIPKASLPGREQMSSV